MLSLMPRAAYWGLRFYSIRGEKLQSCLVLKCFKYYALAMGLVQSFAANCFPDFVLHGMESGLQNDENHSLDLSQLDHDWDGPGMLGLKEGCRVNLQLTWPYATSPWGLENLHIVTSSWDTGGC